MNVLISINITNYIVGTFFETKVLTRSKKNSTMSQDTNEPAILGKEGWECIRKTNLF